MSLPRNSNLHDGDMIKLAAHENSLVVEFVNTPGRGIAWRMYDRFGKGVLLTHEQAEEFYKLLGESLHPKYDSRNEEDDGITPIN
jgi:hypothetical protein